MEREQKEGLLRVIVAAGMTALLMLLTRRTGLPEWAKALLFAIPALTVGWEPLKEAVEGVCRREKWDENLLTVLAAAGAFCLGDYVEGVAVLLFFQIGELFEDSAVEKSRRNILALTELRPDRVTLERDGGVVTVSPEEAVPGEIMIVLPGERIPLDGTIMEGETALDLSALTGESVPKSAGIGADIPGGCVNLNGVIRARVTRPFGESFGNRILELVENAASRKAETEKAMTRFASVYTPTVCIGAMALAAVPPLVRMMLGLAPAWRDWIYRALSFLVISCPCALVIGIPLTFFAAVGGAGRKGILIKGSQYLETLADLKTVVFDKTGTLTEGVFGVTEIDPVGVSEAELLEIAAHTERHSTHPIALSILRAWGKDTDPGRVSEIRELAGKGVSARVDGKAVLLGNQTLMEENGIAVPGMEKDGTLICVASDGACIGVLRISDRIREESCKMLAELEKLGVRRRVMLTGDSRSAAEKTAGELGITEYFGDLLPGDKLTRVENLLGELKPKEKLAFVGDGINDAPVLARADIGIAMGALGSDAAVETADVVLMEDRLRKIPLAIRIARKCRRIVRENIVLALGIKVLCLALSAFGVAGLWVSVVADVGVLMLTVLNAVRAMNTDEEGGKTV